MIAVLSISIPLILHMILAIGFSLRVLYRKLEVNTTLAWIVILFAIPFVGSVAYLFFGNYRLSRRRRKLNRAIQSSFQQAFNLPSLAHLTTDGMPERFRDLAISFHKETGFPVLSGNTYLILTDPSQILHSMRQDIDQAQTTCSLEFYIVDPHGLVESVLMALERAALRGVACRILADDFGSRAFFRSTWPGRLSLAGVEIVRSLPVGMVGPISKRSDLRNHRKLLICDQTATYLGSFNLIDPTLFKVSRHVGQWVDTMMRIEGPIVDAISCVFNTDFLFDTHVQVVSEDNYLLPCGPPRCVGPDQTGTMMQLLPSGPEMRRAHIYDFIVTAIFNAKHRVRVITPYFIPDPAIMLALTSAAMRGVSVEIIVPAKLDSRMAQFAGQSTYDELISAGVAIQRFSAGLLHSKFVLIDDDMSVFGTVNVDPRSFYLNLELSVLIYGTKVNQDLDAIADSYLLSSIRLTAEQWNERSPVIRLMENLLRLASPLL